MNKGLVLVDRFNFSRTLNVVGVGMLIPMPPLWAADALMIATNTFHLPGPAITHSAVVLWETALSALGFHVALDVPWAPAIAVGLGVNGLGVHLGATFVR